MNCRVDADGNETLPREQGQQTGELGRASEATRARAKVVFALLIAVLALAGLLAFTTLSPLLGVMIAIITLASVGYVPDTMFGSARRVLGEAGGVPEMPPDEDTAVDPVTSRLVGAGYLASDVEAMAVVREDARRLAAAGTTADEVSDLLSRLHRGAILEARDQQRFGEFLRSDKWLAALPPTADHFTQDDVSLVLAPFTLEVERCAWGCRIDGPEPGAALVVNRELGEYCYLSAVALHYICRHGFFGDLGSPHRTDPVTLARTLGLSELDGRGVRRVGDAVPRAWEAWILEPFRAASVELALLDIYYSYKDGNTTPYIVAREGTDAGRVWPLTGAAVGIMPDGVIVTATEAPTRLVPTGHGVVISGDGMSVNGLAGATTLQHRDVIATANASFLYVSPHEPYVAPSGWLR